MNDSFFGEPISVYTREQAIQDGVLVSVGNATVGDTPIPVCFTASLLADYPNLEHCRAFICQGFALLNTPDPEDDGSRKLRVVVENRVWVIWDGDGITFLRPEDY